MRDIKFRGKRKDNGEWIIGDLVRKAFDGTSRTIDLGIRKPNRYPIEVLPETVGEFTGLEDINGKDIYEGDIIQDLIVGMKSQIVFTDYANFGIKSLAEIKDLEYDVIDPSWTETSVEIIGNIHDNPELLNS